MDWYKSTAARLMLRQLGLCYSWRSISRMQTLSIACGGAEQVITSAVPWGPQGWRWSCMNTCLYAGSRMDFESTCARAEEPTGPRCLHLIKSQDKCCECRNLKRKQDSVSFLEWFLAPQKQNQNRISHWEPDPPAKGEAHKQLYVPRHGTERVSEANFFF